MRVAGAGPHGAHGPHGAGMVGVVMMVGGQAGGAEDAARGWHGAGFAVADEDRDGDAARGRKAAHAEARCQGVHAFFGPSTLHFVTMILKPNFNLRE